MPFCVIVASSRARAMPKSSSLTLPSSSTITLPGFRSRWIRPFWCTSSSARATSIAMRRPSS